MREGPIKVRTCTTNLTSNSRVYDKAVKRIVHTKMKNMGNETVDGPH